MIRKEVVIGDARLILGNCLDCLDEVVADCVVTDPPYGINLADNSKGGRYGRRKKAWQYAIIGDDTNELGVAVLERFLTLPVVAFASPKRPWPGEWSSFLVWDKGPAVGGGGDVKRCWKPTWELIQVARAGILNGQRDAAVLRHWVTPNLSAEHPAAKPVDLMLYLIEKVSSVGQTIFDPFMGSAGTIVAALRCGRKAIGIEIHEPYFDIAVRRVREEHERSALFASLTDESTQSDLFAESTE